MRQSSFEKTYGGPASDAQVDGDDSVVINRNRFLGAAVVAAVAFLSCIQLGARPSGVTAESSWGAVIAHGFASGWSWGSTIISTYGPLGFLTPHLAWNPETATAFRIGQIVLCSLWALMMFAIAHRFSLRQQSIVVVAVLVWYPLLIIDIGWIVPFAFAVMLVHDMHGEAAIGRRRRASTIVTILLLSLLALINYTLLLMWAVVVVYAVVAALMRRDLRLAVLFGVAMPAVLIAIWLAVGQSLGGLFDFIASAAMMREGIGAMSVKPAPFVDMIGVIAMLLLFTAMALRCWFSQARWSMAIALIAWLSLACLAWRAGFVRADQHVAIFFGSIFFIALAALLSHDHSGRRASAARWLLALSMLVSVIVCYGKLGLDWSLRGVPTAVDGLLHPTQLLAGRIELQSAHAAIDRLPRTRARLGSSKVDVLMNESSIALVNDLNYQPRPAFQAYTAYTATLARRNEAYLLDPATAPEYVLTKLQSFDNRLPTGDDPSSVLAALRAYIPVDMEGGYLVMKRAGWDLDPLPVPPVADWKQAGLGADLDIDQGPRSKVLFFDIRLNFWGRIRAAIFREPGLSLHAQLTDGSEQIFSLVRQLGPAGMLVSPFVLSENEYLRWHAAIFERRVVSMQLRATDPAEVRWFDPVFAYAIAPIDLPRRDRASLTPELKSALYPGISPAPVAVESPSEQVVQEDGRAVLFVHAPSSLTFDLLPGEWTAKGEFGLMSTAYDCAASDGIALVVERLSSNGSVERLFEKGIDPVHNMTERGAQQFTLEPFEIGAGETLILRGAPGLNDGAKSDCDWMFLGPLQFEGPGLVSGIK